MEITPKIISLNSKNQENDKIKEKLKQIEICPTCLQNVNLSYKNNVLKEKDLNTFENLKQINSLNLERIKISNELQLIEDKISLKQNQIQDLSILEVKLQGIQEKQKRIQEIEKSNILFKKDVEMLNAQLEELNISILGLNKFDKLLKEKKENLNETIKQEKKVEITIAELKREIQVFSNQINELKEKISSVEKIKQKLNYLVDLENWLSKQFVLMVSSVEKNVMNKLKSEFSNLFAEWFSMLVSETFNVRLDDDFTPVIEQQDYEIDYAYLSGGERTAIALAYRLALNQVINSMLSNIKTKGFIILDEPTDGFSEQQLDKMGNVLEQLNANQLIIVSHEPKMESFVENVIKFKKEDQKSIIEK